MLIRRSVIGLFLAILTAGSSAMAREVSISLAENQVNLILTNPSSVPVNYDIVCHKADASGTLLNLTSQTLAPNAKATHVAAITDSGQCASSAPPYWTGTDANSKPYYFCTGTNTYANANTACGTGNSFCYPDLNSSVFQCSSNSFWLKNDGGVQFNNGCSGFAAVTAGKQIAVGNFSYFGQAKKTSSTSACSVFYVATELAVASTSGSVCCPAPAGGSLCKIKINTTATNAFLSSPSFMGGAAF